MKTVIIITITALSSLSFNNSLANKTFNDKLKDWLNQPLVNAEPPVEQEFNNEENENLVFSSDSMKFFAFSAGSFLLLLFFLVFHPSQMRRNVLNNLKHRSIEEQAPRHISIKAHEAKH